VYDFIRVDPRSSAANNLVSLMPGWLKILLSVIAVIVLLVIVAVVAGVIYVAKNKDAWRAKGQEIVTQGRDFGTNTDNQGCVDESILRYKQKSSGMINAFSNNLFMQGCLEKSRPTPRFCDRVPVGDFDKLAEWRAEQCQRYDLAKDPNCEKIMFMPVVIHCNEKKGKEN
jgi:hypothetical protein